MHYPLHSSIRSSRTSCDNERKTSEHSQPREHGGTSVDVLRDSLKLVTSNRTDRHEIASLVAMYRSASLHQKSGELAEAETKYKECWEKSKIFQHAMIIYTSIKPLTQKTRLNRQRSLSNSDRSQLAI